MTDVSAIPSLPVIDICDVRCDTVSHESHVRRVPTQRMTGCVTLRYQPLAPTTKSYECGSTNVTSKEPW